MLNFQDVGDAAQFTAGDTEEALQALQVRGAWAGVVRSLSAFCYEEGHIPH